MSTITVNDSELECAIEFAAAAVPFAHPIMAEFDKLMRAWFCPCGIASFLFQEGATPGVWKYEFTHQDGRKWKQKINFNTAPLEDPLMDFSGDFWRESEFIQHREIRDHVILMHNQFQVSKITVAAP